MEEKNNINTEFKLLEPKEVEVDGKTFILSKFPAFDGYEIMIRYIPVHLSNINGDFEKIKEMVLKVMKYVAVKLPDGRLVRLETSDLVNNHCADGEHIMNLTAMMMDYNMVFFREGKGLTFFQKLEHLAEEKVTAILTAFADNLLRNDKRPSGN